MSGGDALAANIYAALQATRELHRYRAVTYRCGHERRCLLLDVVQTPRGLIFHNPPYKLSPARNDADSSESGRARNTRDGDRHWNAQTYFASECLNVSLNCDHVHRVTLDKDEIQSDLDARHAEVVVAPDGTRRTR